MSRPHLRRKTESAATRLEPSPPSPPIPPPPIAPIPPPPIAPLASVTPLCPTRLPDDLGLHVASFCSLINLAGFAACSHACTRFVVAHLSHATAVSCGRDASAAAERVGGLNGTGAATDDGDDCDDDASYGMDGEHAADDVRCTDRWQSYADGKPRPTWTVALAIRLVCRHARQLRHLDLAELPEVVETSSSSSAVPRQALARLVFENRGTLRRVRVPEWLFGLAPLAALRECAALERFDADEWSRGTFGRDRQRRQRRQRGTERAGATVAAAHVSDAREVFGAAVEAVVTSCPKLASIGFLCHDSDDSDGDDGNRERRAPYVGVAKRRLAAILDAARPNRVLSRLALSFAPAVCLAKLVEPHFSHLVSLKLELDVSTSTAAMRAPALTFPAACRLVARALRHMRQLAQLEVLVTGAHSRSQPDPPAADENGDSPDGDNGGGGGNGSDGDNGGGGGGGAGGGRDRKDCGGDAWYSESLEKITLGVSGGVGIGGARGGRASKGLPRHWPRIVAPALRELVGRVDLQVVTGVLNHSPLLRTIDCVRAKCALEIGADADGQADYEQKFDAAGRLLLTDEAESAFCAALANAGGGARRVETVRIWALPFSARMLDAVARNCKTLAYLRLNVASVVGDVLLAFLTALAPTLRVCVLSPLYDDDAREVNVSSRDPAPETPLPVAPKYAADAEWRAIAMPRLARLNLPPGWRPSTRRD